MRYSSGTTPTDYTYTSQYSNMDDFGLLFYNARWYDPVLGRFTSADTVVPDGVQGYDRYAYVNNSPVDYNDPTGHKLCEDSMPGCGNGGEGNGNGGAGGGGNGGGGGISTGMGGVLTGPLGPLTEAQLAELGVQCGINVDPLVCQVYTNTNSMIYTVNARFADAYAGDLISGATCTLLQQGCVIQGPQYLLHPELNFGPGSGQITWDRFVFNPATSTTEPLFRASWTLNSRGSLVIETFPLGSSSYSASVALKVTVSNGTLRWDSQAIVLNPGPYGLASSQPHIRFITQQTGPNTVSSQGTLTIGDYVLGSIFINGMIFP